MMQLFKWCPVKAEIDNAYRASVEATERNVRTFAHEHKLTIEEERYAQAMALARLNRWRISQYQAAGLKP